MNPYLLLAAVRARFRILLFVLGTTVLVTLVVSLVMPKTYVAKAAVLVDSKDDQQMHTATPEANLRERISYLQTQVDIITSQKVARKVVESLELAKQPESREAFAKATDGDGSIEDWLAMTLLLDLKTDTTQSSIIQIAFPSPDAQFSALVANAFAKAYVATALELRVAPTRQTAAWFDEQIRELRGNLERAQSRLTAYQKEKGLVDERYDVESLALSDIAGEVAKAQSRRAGAPGPEVRESSSSQNIRTELMRAESKLQEYTDRLGTSHPSYQRQLAETQRLRSMLRAEGGPDAPGPTAQNRRRVAELRDELENQRARVLQLKEYRDQLAVLTRDVDIAQKAYETAMQHSVENRVESRANLTNISVLHPAVPPFKATRPIMLLNLALAVVVGTLLGLCIVYLMEMRDHRVRSRRDLRNEWPVPVLAELSSWQPETGRLPGPANGFPALPNPG
ncbi:MAG TPA: Wzz/FepE/Etk N-terminal domain-containing protein [Azonexus sp.]|nr:Wzz/FepE/Etk N-terminal domain-containing protein [Azonexus sp.]